MTATRSTTPEDAIAAPTAVSIPTGTVQTYEFYKAEAIQILESAGETVGNDPIMQHITWEDAKLKDYANETGLNYAAVFTAGLGRYQTEAIRADLKFKGKITPA